jgi:hypothetical protein
MLPQFPLSKIGTDLPSCLAKEKQELAGRLKIAGPMTVILDMSDPFFTDNKIDTTANVHYMTSISTKHLLVLQQRRSSFVFEHTEG